MSIDKKRPPRAELFLQGRMKDSIDTDVKVPPRRRIPKREKTIPINVTSIVLTAFLGFLLITCGYIFNDMKTSFLDLGKMRSDISLSNTSINDLKSTTTVKFEEINKKLDLLISLHTKN